MTLTSESERVAARSRANYLDFRAEVIGDVILDLRNRGLLCNEIFRLLEGLKRDAYWKARQVLEEAGS
jgi:hypothetical protein